MMEKIPIDKLKVISPMFSYGNMRLKKEEIKSLFPNTLDTDKIAELKPEPRPTELKGLLRNTYRISNPDLDLKSLYQYEVMLFGGQIKENKEITIKASPLRIEMSEQMKGSSIDKQRLRLHRKQEWFENGKKQKNYPFIMYNVDKIFELKLSVNYKHDNFSSIPFLKDKKPIQWYTDLFKLSLLIGGIGKRSRRGRGCMTIDELLSISNDDLTKEVATLLNSVCGYKAYIAQEKSVKLTNSAGNSNDRPYIREIHFGKLQDKTKENIKQYLTKVDKASHDIKGKYGSYKATGFAYGENRFASSVIVSLTELKEGIVPVYTLLHAAGNVFKNKDEQTIKEEQDAFIKKIEAGNGK